MTRRGPAIGIMSKAPRVGASKTRLIPALGAQSASDLSAAFLADLGDMVADVAARHDGRGYAVFAPLDGEADCARLFPADFGFLPMVGDDFGRVLFGAGRDLLAAGHACVLLVNGDSPTLPAAFLEQAVAILQAPGERAVFGQALDGGYYLIGTKALHPALFTDIAWSTSVVLEQSLARAQAIGLPTALLPAWYDVDDRDGLGLLAQEFAGCVPPGLDRLGSTARRTRALLTELAHHVGVRPKALHG